MAQIASQSQRRIEDTVDRANAKLEDVESHIAQSNEGIVAIRRGLITQTTWALGDLMPKIKSLLETTMKDIVRISHASRDYMSLTSKGN